MAVRETYTHEENKMHWNFSTSWVKLKRRTSMHNIVSQNNMASWSHSYSDYAVSQDDQKLDDYYECLIECETDQPSCKRICKEILI